MPYPAKADALVSDKRAYRHDDAASPGPQSGNFAQAFTEIALINTAIGLDAALDRRRDSTLTVRILSGMGRSADRCRLRQ
jgi:hypothetical protein